jgi:hypothetical protein
MFAVMSDGDIVDAKLSLCQVYNIRVWIIHQQSLMRRLLIR